METSGPHSLDFSPIGFSKSAQKTVCFCLATFNDMASSGFLRVPLSVCLFVCRLVSFPLWWGRLQVICVCLLEALIWTGYCFTCWLQCKSVHGIAFTLRAPKFRVWTYDLWFGSPPVQIKFIDIQKQGGPSPQLPCSIKQLRMLLFGLKKKKKERLRLVVIKRESLWVS